MTTINIKFDREEDGRWIAEVPELPGVLAYGSSRREALALVVVLAGRVLLGRGESGVSLESYSSQKQRRKPAAAKSRGALAKCMAAWTAHKRAQEDLEKQRAKHERSREDLRRAVDVLAAELE